MIDIRGWRITWLLCYGWGQVNVGFNLMTATTPPILNLYIGLGFVTFATTIVHDPTGEMTLNRGVYNWDRV